MIPQGFEILYEEGPCLVVSKPGGLLTQAPPGIDSLEIRIKRFLKRRESKPGKVYLGVPHRLDRPVSGAMVFAKHVRAARRLSEQFQGRLVRKTYLAMVEGRVEQDQGVWNDHVRKTPGQARAEIVDSDHPEAKNAVLHFQVLWRGDDKTLLEIELETGRTHQIRLQASSRTHPVLGDQQYHSQVAFGPETEDERSRCIALHARFLGFRHPMSREEVFITAEMPQYWAALLENTLGEDTESVLSPE